MKDNFMNQETINALTDAQVVSVVKDFFAKVFRDLPQDQLADNIKGADLVASLAGLDDATLAHELSAGDSAALSRAVLLAAAQNESLAGLAQECIDKVVHSDELFVEAIVALGLLVNLTLLMATTEVRVDRGTDGKIRWHLGKTVAGPQLVKAVIDPLAKVARSIKQ